MGYMCIVHYHSLGSNIFIQGIHLEVSSSSEWYPSSEGVFARCMSNIQPCFFFLSLTELLFCSFPTACHMLSFSLRADSFSVGCLHSIMKHKTL